jgi:PAT family beta-lactamase induction signal transducer AmpG
MVFIVVALFMLVGVVMTLVIDEAIKEPSPPQTLKASVIEPFREFVGRSGLRPALLVLTFLFFYKLGDNMATAMQTTFFHDVGFSGTQIGTIAKLVGTTSAIVGGMIGGLVMVKLSINRALWLFGFVQITSILGFALLSIVGANPWMLAFAMAFEYLGVGLGTVALTAFIAKSTNVAFAATQFALFTALASVPRVFASATTGLIVEQVGWTDFFLLCTVLAIPGMMLLFKVAPWNEDTV